MKTVIIGTGGMGRETLWILRASNDAGRTPLYNIEGFVTSLAEQHGCVICGLPVLGPKRYLVGRGDVQTVCAIGNPRDRARVCRQLLEQGVQFVSAVHPSAVVCDSAVIGRGCIIGANATISADTRIGDHVIVNINASVSHDSVLEDYVTLAPGVNIAGNVSVGYGADLGINCCVLPRVRIGRGAIVGAGAVVKNDIDDNCVAVGVPARVVRRLPLEEAL